MLNAIKRHVLPITVIMAASVVVYAVLTKQMTLLRESNSEGSNDRVEDIRAYQFAVYETMLSEVLNDKRVFYILISGSTVLFTLILMNIVKLLMKQDETNGIFRTTDKSQETEPDSERKGDPETS